MASIQIANSAKYDFREIFDFIFKQSIQNAEKLISTIKKEITNLEKHPEIGQIVKEINDPEFREIKVYKYRIIYHFQHDKVSIITIHHSSRLLNNNPHLKDFFE
ncbi:MAG: type II toxin-antitoxin system RelE/ParE family toxin [Ferruginibacter sp.]